MKRTVSENPDPRLDVRKALLGTIPGRGFVSKTCSTERDFQQRNTRLLAEVPWPDHH